MNFTNSFKERLCTYFIFKREIWFCNDLIYCTMRPKKPVDAADFLRHFVLVIFKLLQPYSSMDKPALEGIGVLHMWCYAGITWKNTSYRKQKSSGQFSQDLFVWSLSFSINVVCSCMKIPWASMLQELVSFLNLILYSQQHQKLLSWEIFKFYFLTICLPIG